MSTFDLKEVLKISDFEHKIELINQEIQKVVELAPAGIKEPLERLTLGYGKRIRPALICAIAKEANHKVFKVAAAIELTHISSLIHDDIIDNSDLRWGHKTINKVEGQNAALIIGDYLFAESYKLALESDLEVGRIIARCIKELCEGEMYEIKSLFNFERTESNYFQTIQKKTSSLFIGACEIGGILNNYPKEYINLLKDYGNCLGEIFQLIDDLLDFISDPELIGKTTQLDIGDGVFNLPLIVALRTNKDLKKHIINKEFSRAYQEVIDSPAIVDTVLKIIRRIDYSQRIFANKPEFQMLSKFSRAYYDWVKKNLVSNNHRTLLR